MLTEGKNPKCLGSALTLLRIDAEGGGSARAAALGPGQPPGLFYQVFTAI